MKNFQFVRNMFAMLAVALAFTACGEDPIDTPAGPTTKPVPTVTLAAGEAAETSLSFTVTTKDAELVKWAMVPQSLTPTAESILENGTEVAANTTVTVEVPDLMSDCEYLIYAAAKNADHTKLSEVLKMKTLKNEDPGNDNPGDEAETFEMLPTHAATEVTEGEELDNYNITFSDSENDMTLTLNLYTAHGYTPEGLFAFDEELDADVILFEHSHFVMAGTSKAIVGGEVVFSGSSVEEDQYSVEGIIELENNEMVEFFYEGKLGLPVAPAGPEEVYMNLVSGSAEAGTNPGEWVLTLYDDFRNEVVLYCVSPTNSSYPNYLPDGSYWFCSPDENYSSDKYGWVNTELSYIKFGGETLKVLPRDLSVGRNTNMTFSTNYDLDSPRDSNTLKTNTNLLSENGAYSFSLNFSGPLYGDGSTTEVGRELDYFTHLIEYSTSPDGTKLLIRLYCYYGDLYFCLVPGENKMDVSGSVVLGKDENGKWFFEEYESYEFDVATEMDLTRSYLWEQAMGNGNASIYYLTSGSIRISRVGDSYSFLAINLKGKMVTPTITYIVNFSQSNPEKGWSAKWEDTDDWSYDWEKVPGSFE